MFWLRRCHLAVLLSLSALTLAPIALAADSTTDEIAARVNGTPISRKSVREVVVALASTQEEPPSSQQVEQFSRDALDSLIAFELLYQESRRRDIPVTAREIEAAMASSKARFPSADAYAKALAQQGMSLDDVRRETHKTLAVNRLLEQTVWQDLTIPPERVQDFYEQNREQFKRPAEIRASHIFFRAPRDAAAADRAKAKQRAADVLDQIKKGADFAELAQKHSQDVVTAPKGGDLGFFSRGSMDHAFEEAVFALEPGEVGEVVETRYGFHLVKLTERRPARHATLAEVEDNITALLRDEEKRKRQDQFVAQLRKHARIEILPAHSLGVPGR